jgi:hypothetical protein
MDAKLMDADAFLVEVHVAIACGDEARFDELKRLAQALDTNVQVELKRRLRLDAVGRRERAELSLAQADFEGRLHDLLYEHGVRTVRDLPPDVLGRVLREAEGLGFM